MNIHVDIGHPSDVHFFRHAMAAWREHGHGVFTTCRAIPVAQQLMEGFGIVYEVVSRKRAGLALGLELIEHAARLWPRLRKNRIDLSVSFGGTFTVHAALLAGCRRVVFYDTDTATAANRITYPFASHIVTPAVYPGNLGRKHRTYRGLKELAYLQPGRFSADASVPAKYGLDGDTPYSVVRFSAWEASHDMGLETATLEDKLELVAALQSRGNVLVVPEGRPPPELAAFCRPIEPQDFHHLLYHAGCCVTEGASTASEAAVLGTPVLYTNPLQPCYIPWLAREGLLGLSPPGDDMPAALSRLPRKDALREKAAAFVAAQDDVTAFVVDFVENLQR